MLLDHFACDLSRHREVDDDLITVRSNLCVLINFGFVLSLFDLLSHNQQDIKAARYFLCALWRFDLGFHLGDDIVLVEPDGEAHLFAAQSGLIKLLEKQESVATMSLAASIITSSPDFRSTTGSTR